MAAELTPGAVLVLPWHLYRPYAWNGDRVVPTRPSAGSPAGRSATTTWSWSASLRSARTPTGAASARWSVAPRLALALPGAGVRFVLVFKEGDWRAWSARLDGLVPALDRPELFLYCAGATGAGALPGSSGRPRGRGRPSGPGRARCRPVPIRPFLSDRAGWYPPPDIAKEVPNERVDPAALAALAAAAALVLAFNASLVLVSSQNASSVSTKPLVVYGSR